jgi:hypothetical protein
MDPRAQRSLLALAAVLSLGLPARAGGANGAGAPGEDAASVSIEAALREVLVSGWMVAGWPEEQVVAELVSIGPRAIAKLFAIHAGLDFEPWEGEGLSFDRGPERGAFLAGRALCALPRREVVAFLRQHARPTDPPEVRLSAIGLYAALGSLEELVPTLALVGSFSEEDLASPTLRTRLPQDLTRLFERVPRAALDTASACSALPAAVRRPVSEALLAFDHPCAIEALPAMLGTSVEDDVRVLERLAELGERYPWRLSAIEPDFVAGLLRAGDWRIRRAACVLAGRWQEAELFEALVRLHEQDPQPAVQRAALFALHTLSASKLELDGTGWERWLTAQKSAWDRESAGLLEELASSDPARVSQALRRASQFPLHRRETAPLFAAVLFHHTSLAETVSAVLVEAQARQAVPTLVDVMGRAVDPRARMVAWMTLKRLTQREARIDDPSWVALVE